MEKTHGTLIQYLLERSESELLQLIGSELDSTFHIRPSSRDSLIKEAKRWLSRKEQDIRKAICGSTRIRNHVHSDDNLVLISAIADLLSSICTGVSPFTVSVLLYKRGVKEFCLECWKTRKPET